VAVGRQRFSNGGVDIPTLNALPWGSSSSIGDSSAIISYFKASNLYNANDSLFSFVASPLSVPITLFGNAYSNKNILKWQVPNPTDINHYTLQKSADGIIFYELEKNIASSNQMLEYTDMDLKLNTNYYRLLVTNSNQTISYTNIIRLQQKTKPSTFIYPNPATTSFTKCYCNSKQYTRTNFVTISDHRFTHEHCY
jgi:hypothetical protein